MPTSNEIYIQRNTRTSHKRWESMVVYALHFALRNIRIESQYKVGIYFIDAFLPEANLAIEIDEEHHKLNKLNDMYRQSVIEKMIGCKFIRIDVEQDVYVQIDRIINYVENLNLPKWTYEPPIFQDGNYSRTKNAKLEANGIYDFVEKLLARCSELELNTSDLISSDSGNGMLGFRVNFDGLVLQLITGVSKKIKFQVYEFDPQSLEKADLRVTEPIRNTYRNIIGFEKGCSEEIAFDLITKIRNRIN